MKVSTATIAGFGLTVGLLSGLLVVLYSYLRAPGQPGRYELTLQIIMVGSCGAIGAAFGTLLALIGKFLRKRK
jgi:hypothetical protein